MNAPLDVFLIETNDANKFLFRTESLFDAIEMIREHGLGSYLVFSQNSRRKRFYEVKAGGEVLFREREQ